MQLARRQAASRLSVILNPSAGTAAAEESPDRLRELLGSEGSDVRVVSANDGPQILRLAREELAGGADTVVAAGGDGTVNAVASALVGTDRVLGVLPLGTWNHFARDLRIPTDLESAARVIRDGEMRTVDVGEVNGRLFLNNSSIGLYPTLVRDRREQQARLGRSKLWALFWATVRVLLHHHSVRVRVQADGEERVFRTALLFIGNNAYTMQGFEIGTRSRMDAGELSLYMTKHPGSWPLIRLALRALFGRLNESEHFEAFPTREASIETRHPRIPVAIDGDVSQLETPLHYRTIPRALRVLVPREPSNVAKEKA
jgi:YegS/Rv2252/BmrU family lipid kinase